MKAVATRREPDIQLHSLYVRKSYRKPITKTELILVLTLTLIPTLSPNLAY